MYMYKGGSFIARTIGVVLLLASVLLMSGSLVSADLSTYSLNWQSYFYNDFASRMSQERAGRVRSTTNSNAYTDWVCLGPAEWMVTGNINGDNIREVWSVSSWHNTMMEWDANQNITYDYLSMPSGGYYTSTAYTCGMWGADGNNPLNGAGQTRLPWGIKPSGQYGAFVLELSGFENVYKAQWQAMESRPSSWSIEGCVYNSSAELAQCLNYWQTH